MPKETQFPNLVEDYLRRVNRACRTSYGSKSIATSPKDVESFIYSYWFGVALLMQCRPWQPQVVGHFKQLLNNLLECSGYLGFIESCSEARGLMSQSGSTTSLSKGSTRWARSLERCINAVFQQPVRHPSKNFNTIMTFLGWLKRVPIFIRSKDEAASEYLANEDRLSHLTFDHHYVDLLRSVWLEFYGDFALSPAFRPRHGSGSTADAGVVASNKWKHLHTDQRCRILLKSRSLEMLHVEGSDTSSRVAKVVFVPKQAGKDRTICMEPSWLQYLQQGVFDQLREYLSICPAHRHFDIHNQDINRDLCARAYTEGFSTIDLSNASDSVSWNLIKSLARGSRLLSYLYATRSDQARLANSVITMNKFAPMGSALCFPIECMLFACIVEVAYRIHFGQPSCGHRSGVAVYGDDIICPQEIYHLVVDILQTVGFVVNEAKSFETGPYFESCGVEYLYGARITTIRHPRGHIIPNDMVSPDRVGMITDLANTLSENGFYDARRLLLKSYEKAKVRVRKTVFSFHDLIDWSPNGLVPIGDVYRRLKWDPFIQRSYYEQPIVVTRPNRSWADYRHYQCLQSFQRDPDPSVHPKWSDKGKLALLRMGHYDLLRSGEIESAGSCRAGRLHYTATRNKRYV